MEYIVFWLIMAIICSMVAASKGRSGALYFFSGLLIWPIVLVYALLIPRPVSEIRAIAAQVPVPVAEGVIGGVPYWRRGVHYAAMIGGREIAFQTKSDLEEALASPAAPTSVVPQSAPVDPATVQQFWRDETGGFVGVVDGVQQRYETWSEMQAASEMANTPSLQSPAIEVLEDGRVRASSGGHDRLFSSVAEAKQWLVRQKPK